MAADTEQHASLHLWRARMRKRRGRGLDSGHSKELNLVAMMDMMTIILVFLLKSYSGSTLTVNSSQNFQFPKSTHQITPVDATKLTVSNYDSGEGQIIVNSDIVATLDSKAVLSMKRKARNRDYMIPELFKALKKEAAMVKAETKIRNEDATTYEGNILIIADKELPYWLLTAVLFTSAEAGFDKYNLVAVKKHQ
ncbi:biopolymer transporter ExbD [bacterium]|nr:biopolymer transporter ExbD [bacterium]